MKIQNGTVRNIIIPAERAFTGWEEFNRCLQSFFIKSGYQRSVGPDKNTGAQGQTIREYRGGPLQRQQQLKSGTIVEGKSAEKSSKAAMVVIKQRSLISWKAIKESLERRTGRIMEVVPFAADRAMSWCASDDEKRDVLKDKELLNGGVLLGRVEIWDMVLHWENIKIEARFSWIGIEGLPLNLWSMDTFQKIGEACGGLLEVAEDTIQKSFLLYAKIKVKGYTNGFLYPIAEILCEKNLVQNLILQVGGTAERKEVWPDPPVILYTWKREI